MRTALRHERKAFAGRYYKLLSGHMAVGSYLCDRTGKLASNKCWWCGMDERQPRYHPFVKSEARKPQIAGMWEGVGKRCGGDTLGPRRPP